MKKMLRLLSLCLLLIIWSCSTKVDLNGSWHDITVVYGLLNQADTFSYIKINKAFLGEGDILTMAQNPDSSSYGNNLNVVLEEYGTTGNLIKKIIFDTATVTDKEPGTFYYPNQIVYKANTLNLLDENNTYKLIITNKLTNKVITAQTPLVHALSLSKPSNIIKIMPYTDSTSSFSTWTSTENGRKYQLCIRFNYKEVSTGGTDTAYNHIDWLFPYLSSSELTGGEEMSQKYVPSYLLELIKAKVPVNTGVSRIVSNTQFILSVAADDFSTYLDVSAPSTGIVQDKPDYTNITNGIGIFSSRYKVQSRDFKVDDNTINKIKSFNLGFIK